MKLFQQRRWYGSRTFTLTDHDTIEVTIKARGNIKEYEVPLSSLAPQPERRAFRCTEWIASSIAFVCVGAIVVAMGFFLPEEDRAALPALLTIGILLMSPAIYKYFQSRLKDYDILYYFDSQSGSGSIPLFYRVPASEDYDDFIAELNRRIALAAEPVSRTSNLDDIVGELERFATLVDREIISEEEFEDVKAKLLAKLGPSGSSIGFQP